MNKKHFSYPIIGFLFGSFGLYVLALLALIFPFFEALGSILFAPGRILARMLLGSNGSSLDVLLLTIANGILYAILFWAAHALITRSRKG
jgi:hypothetical protein